MAVDPTIYAALVMLLIGRAQEETGFHRLAILIFAWGMGIIGTIHAAADLLGLKP